MRFKADEFGVYETHCLIDGRWWVAEPIDYFKFDRFIQAWDVITGKAHTVYFKPESDGE
jgi:hypothetical protein